MLPRLLILHSTTIILSVLVLCTRTSIHDIDHHQQEQQQQQRVVVGNNHHHHLFSLIRLGNLVGPSKARLQSRAALPPYLISPEWIVDNHDFTSVLPISLAAIILQGFYENVAAYAATTVSALARCTYQLWFGQMMLEIVVPGWEKVEWVLVRNFAPDMLEMTKKGYSNTFQINSIHGATGKMVTFK